MGNINSTLTLATPSGGKVRASITKEANSTIDREIALTAGEFVEVFVMDTKGYLGDSTPVANSLPDFRQLVAYNTGDTPLEIALKTHLIDDGDGLTHAEIYSYPTFFIPSGGYLAIPSPRIISTSGTDTTPESLNYVSDAAGRCTAQLNLRATASTATYTSDDGKTKLYGLSADGITNSRGELYISGLHGKANHDNSSTAATWVCTDGIVPGTMRIQFYYPAFSSFNFTKNGIAAQTSTSSTLLAANTAYNIGLNVNGGGAADVTFTTDTTDVTWGSPTSGTGVLYKIQTAMDAAERECDVSLVDGNLRFTSRSRLQTSSAVVIAGASGGGNDFKDHGIMSAGYIEATGIGAMDDNDNDIMFDNGEGILSRANGGSGTVNYGVPGSPTAKCDIYITGCPANSSINMAWLHGSTSGGNLSTLTPADSADENDETNCLLGVYARAISYSLVHGKEGRKGKLRMLVVDNTNYESGNY